MPNKNLNQFSLLTAVDSGDFLLLWDTSAGLTYKVYANDIANLLSTTNPNPAWFENIYVRNRARISGIIGGNTGTNLISGNWAGILGGTTNTASGASSVIAGGQSNYIVVGNAFIGGGDTNQILNSANYSVIGGGLSNSIIGNTATIVGGDTNRATGDYTFIGGGLNNNASGHYSVIPGGTKNSARRDFSFAAGRNSVADHDGSHVFSDARGIDKVSVGQNTFTADFSGGCWITGGGLNARMGFNLFPTGTTPSSSIGGRSGDFAYKDDFLYVFTGDNADLSNRNWGRIQLSTLNNTPPSVVSNSYRGIWTQGDIYQCTTTFANVAHTGPNLVNPSISIVAGQATYVMDCIFGARRGTNGVLHYRLQNATDDITIPNTSGFLVLPGVVNESETQIHIRTVTGVNYGGVTNVRLQVRVAGSETAGNETFVLSTGGSLTTIKLE